MPNHFIYNKLVFYSIIRLYLLRLEYRIAELDSYILCRVGDCILIQVGALLAYLKDGLVHLQINQLLVARSAVPINDSAPHSVLLVRSYTFLLLLLDGEQIGVYTG